MAAMKNLTVSSLLKAMQAKQYKVFEGELNLNLIGVRHTNTKANSFNDVLCVLYQQDGKWQLVSFKCTTDAGTYYRENPCNVDGTAVLAAMQHRSLWTFGYHQGKYPALVQHKPVTVYRDNNNDNQLDCENNLQRGYFGINCHRASANHESKQVDKWSAGCQVLANPNDFNKLMALCHQSSQQWGSTFTYTLLNQIELNQAELNPNKE
ncbi:hypothetical protein ACU5B6_08485 [Moritella viscosa]|uniref:hypothetical protein n=1 Tax=Moritella viscosa TaxID=80854 RepID=UPI0009245E83|nr:hypothetical protein [Moritella viscosa]SHO00166.1 Putative uncharacterized protein [Moritella viscosa]